MHFSVLRNSKMSLKYFSELKQLLSALIREVFALLWDILTD